MRNRGIYALTAFVVIGLCCAFTPQAYAVPGDLNCSGQADLGDIDAFVLALVDPGAYATAYPGCDIHQADMNTDGAEDGLDIPEFVSLMLTTTTEPPVRAQLAGNSLSGYPHFNFVRAFHELSPIKIAIDPYKLPDLVGVTCDVYVTNAKSVGGWMVDPSLDDVSTGPITITISGAGIESNIHTVAAAGVLSGFAGTDLGVGYDVVLDCNQNGILDSGDVIDGMAAEAGFYVVRDTTQAGPLAVTEAIYSGGTWLGQDLYYPTDIASMGECPLVVVSHGNGHDYTWYDHIGYHLASYGYIVMSHTNNTGPGVEDASTTTLTNTDYIIGNQATIQGGVLNGHIDSHRITWIGHSRGAEGVVRAYTRVRLGQYTPSHFTLDDLWLVSSMCPVTHISPVSNCTPHDVNYHLFIAGADADVTGSASSSSSKPLAFYERAYGNKQVVYVHGAGHGDFHDGGGSSVADGPDLIGRPATHQVVKGYYLPLVKLYIENNIVAKDFLTRMYENFHPYGIGSNVIIANYYRDAEATDLFTIDDYQTETGLTTSSSGGSVSYTVQNAAEILMQDIDGSFSWTGSQPSNGMTMYRYTGDDGHCIVFDWGTGSQRSYELAVIPGERDFTRYSFLSFRACQGTQHPYTNALDAPLSFSVTLRDSASQTSTIDFGRYGRVTRTYERDGGWANEFNTVRIRLSDFEADGNPIDMTDIVAVEMEFGSGFGSSQGRIGLDDIELTQDYPPYLTPLSIDLSGGAQEFVPPGVGIGLLADLAVGSDTLVAGSAQVHYRYGGGSWITLPLIESTPGSGIYNATLPAPACADAPEYYLSAEGMMTGVVYDPPAGAANPYVSFVGTYVSVLADDFDTDQGWTVENDPSMGPGDGQWDRAIPGIDVDRGAPPSDFDGSGYCYVTGDALSEDVDNGPTWLVSPTLDLSAMTNPVIRYARWWSNDDQDGDMLTVEVSNDDGATWYILDYAMNVPAEWVERSGYVLDAAPSLTSQMKIRFGASDVPNNSKDEGAIDAFELFDVTCVD